MTKLSNKVYRLANKLFCMTENKCLCCGADVFDNNAFCQQCSSSVVFNNGKTCKRCGVGIDGEEDYCGNCSFDKVYFDKAYSVFSYEGNVKTAILKMKFNGLGSYSLSLAKYLVFLANKNNLQFDVVCCVPMFEKQLRKRRYNQSQMLANAFCNLLDCQDKYVDALVKTKQTTPQEQLNKQERKQNLVGAYKLVANVLGKRVLVIDDVKTTGSTLNECAKVLKRGGATEVVGLTVASRKEHVNFELEEV